MIFIVKKTMNSYSNEGFLRRQKHIQTNLKRKKEIKVKNIEEVTKKVEEIIPIVPLNKEEINSDCLITVAMPLYNMGQIATLALEGLCNQKTQYPWELIVCEEQNESSLGIEKLFSYEDRLRDANCVRIKYLPLMKWKPLGDKWRLIAEESSDTIGFILQAGDDYSHSKRIELTCETMLSGYTFYNEHTSYWYSFRLNKTILFNPDDSKYTHPCKLNMAWKTSLIKQLPKNEQKMNVDHFLYTQMSKIEKVKKYTNYELYDDGVFVDGYNIISSRNKFFIQENHLYKFTDVDIKNRIPILNDYLNLVLTVPMKEKL